MGTFVIAEAGVNHNGKNSSNRILLCSVIFPNCSKYFGEFFNSIKNQTYPFFDFLIVNDGVELEDNIELPLNSIVVPAVGTPAENRVQTINYAITQDYDIIAWQDCDDTCGLNRLEQIAAEIGDFDVLVHDMSIINEHGVETIKSFIGEKICPGKIQYQDILFYNFMGFGNMAVKVKALACVGPIPRDTVAVDWLIATSLLLNGADAVYWPEVLSSYRQYAGNTASVVSYSKIIIRRQILCIIKHYQILFDMFPALFELNDSLKDYYNQLLRYQKDGYPNIVSEDTNGLLWWEKIYTTVKGY